MSITFRSLMAKDEPQVALLDNESGNYVSQWVTEEEIGDEESDYAFGLFDGDTLIGYCTIGGADDVPDIIENHPAKTPYSLLLSDLYIKPDYRHKRLGVTLCLNAIATAFENEPAADSLFITLLYDRLASFYEIIGFVWADDTKEYAMVLTKDAFSEHNRR